MDISVTASPEQKRPALHKKIDELPDEEIEVVEKLLAKLEMDRLWKELREDFAGDWVQGKYDHLDEIIREVQAGFKQRGA